MTRENKIKEMYENEESNFDSEDYQEAKKAAENIDTFYHVVRKDEIESIDVEIFNFKNISREVCFSLADEPLFTADQETVLIFKMIGKAEYLWENDVNSEYIDDKRYAIQNGNSSYSEVWSIPSECKITGVYYNCSDEDENEFVKEEIQDCGLKNLIPSECENGMIIF